MWSDRGSSANNDMIRIRDRMLNAVLTVQRASHSSAWASQTLHMMSTLFPLSHSVLFTLSLATGGVLMACSPAT
jgi:hypothetical protein